MNAGGSRLVRGIDPIPDMWEFASGYQALASLRRSQTILARLMREALEHGNATLHRDLARIETGVRRGIDNISGGFDRREIELMVAKLEAAGRVTTEAAT